MDFRPLRRVGGRTEWRDLTTTMRARSLGRSLTKLGERLLDMTQRRLRSGCGSRASDVACVIISSGHMGVVIRGRLNLAGRFGGFRKSDKVTHRNCVHCVALT